MRAVSAVSDVKVNASSVHATTTSISDTPARARGARRG